MSKVTAFFRTLRREQGQVLIMVVILLTALLGFVGLVADTGHLYAQRRQAQNAADEAATAGARERYYGGSVAAATTTVLSNASGNGFNNNGTTNTVTVHIPPTSGPHTGDSNYVEVVVWEQPKTLFIHVLGVAGSVQSRGVAGFVHTPKNYALLVLNPTMCSAYDQTSSNVLTINGGGSMVNSSCQPSGSQGGGSSLNADYIDYYNAGSWSLGNNATTSVPPSGVGSQIADPLASLAEPVPCAQNGTPAGCIAQSTDSTGTANNPRLTGPVTSSFTFHPGTYYGGIKITGGGGTTFTFLPGIYVMAGGGLDMNTSGTVTGNGVMFYNTYDSAKANQGPTSPMGAGACGDMKFSASATSSLTGPSSGAYKDLVFWQDNACTNTFDYTGSGNTTAGIIYLPTAQLNLRGGGSIGAIQIIVDSFNFSGSAATTIDYGNYVQITAPRVALVE